jgi:hypothetical protein
MLESAPMIAHLLISAALLAAAPAVRTPAPAAAGVGAELRLVPAPREIVPGSGAFPLRGEIRIAVASRSDEDRFAASQLAAEIASGSSATARVVDGAEGDIVLARDPALAHAGDEGYRIEVRTTGIRRWCARAASRPP